MQGTAKISARLGSMTLSVHEHDHVAREPNWSAIDTLTTRSLSAAMLKAISGPAASITASIIRFTTFCMIVPFHGSVRSRPRASVGNTAQRSAVTTGLPGTRHRPGLYHQERCRARRSIEKRKRFSSFCSPCRRLASDSLRRPLATPQAAAAALPASARYPPPGRRRPQPVPQQPLPLPYVSAASAALPAETPVT